MIGLMDCNNFFASCERLFRPDLRGKPVAVLSSNDGCIVARSQEVKDLGIPMGAPYFQVKDMCTKGRVHLFSSNFPLYRDVSRRVMSALREEFGTIAVYSIDEAFFDVPDSYTEADIQEVRERIVQKTGIPVSFGIAPTKTIAKIAGGEAKKSSGVCILTVDGAAELYSSLSCGSVWGIGREMTKKLESFNIRTVTAFCAQGVAFARAQFGVQGERIFLELSGICAHAEKHDTEYPGSIMSTRSFHTTITEKHILESALGHHVAHIGEKLRDASMTASGISIICAPSRHGAFALRRGHGHLSLEEPTNDTQTLLKAARTLLDQVYEHDVPYKKAGAIVSGLIPEAYVAPRLFSDVSRENQNTTVYNVVDALNHRFGRGTVRPGVVHSTDAWAPSTRLRSQEYTTRWSEIACVKAI